MTGLATEFLDAGEHFAERIAIVDGDLRISYAQLTSDARALAVRFRRAGLQEGARVAVIMDNCWQYPVAFYGTLLAGGSVVPLNAASKSTDFANWIRHCEPQFVVVHGSAAGEVAKAVAASPTSPQLVHCDQDGVFFGEGLGSAENTASAGRLPDIDVHACACILYTSGTTGTPKGVMLSAANLGHNADAIIQYLELTQHDRSVLVLPLYYSYGNSVLQTHLRVGATLIVQNKLIYPHLIVEALAAHRATGFAGVPSTFRLLLDRVKLENYDLTSLRYITQAGGPMDKALTLRMQSALPKTKLYVMYGQTEAAARLTYLPPEKLQAKLGSVGIPIPGVKIEIRNDEGAAVPARVEGHVWARGPNVMMRYWHNPDATTAVLADGWLNTGDIGCLDEEGYLFLAGRRSDIIKVGAHRVHPKDVEDALSELPAVKEAAVFGAGDPILGEAIHAWVVPMPGADLDVQQIKRHCLSMLPAYKVPKVVTIVAGLPRTASGKLWRAALNEVKSNE